MIISMIVTVTNKNHPARFVVCPACGMSIYQWCGRKFELHEQRIALARRIPARRRLPGSFESGKRR
jgi:hypothetical protein